jgi:hypothetical protein
MKFRTELNPRPVDQPLDHNSGILLIGSCFSDHMAARLRYGGFKVLENPHGILFNPLSIAEAVQDCLDQRTFTPEDLLFNGEKWVSLSHHGRFSGENPEAVLNRINDSIGKAHDFLLQCSHLVLTLGTSWVYRHVAQERIAANCHKIPQKEFEKELLQVDEIISSLEGVLSGIRSIRPKVTVLLTVSPVRHLRDGILENTRSKARLHEAVHTLVEGEGVHYFPSYEIMMDDLRDYRFYEPDMIHPNRTAIDYIWEKFCEAWIHPESRSLMGRVERIHRALEHRPLFPESEKHTEFSEKIQQEIDELKKQHPEICFLG